MSYKAYRVRVKVDACFDNLVVVVNQNAIKASYHEAVFYRLVFSIPDDGLSIPSSRTATFKEQLRVLKKAYDFIDLKAQSIDDYITSKMKEVYGDNSDISSEEMQEES